MVYRFKVATHFVIAYVAVLMAYALPRSFSFKWWVNDPEAMRVFVWAAGYATVALIVELFAQLEKTSWRFSSAKEVLRLARSTGMTAVIFLIIVFMTSRAVTLPRSSMLLLWILNLFGLVAVRLAWRTFHDKTLIRSLFSLGDVERRSSPPLIIIGEVNQAEVYLRQVDAAWNQDYHPVMIIAKGSSRSGQIIHGCPVFFGFEKLTEYLAGAIPDTPGAASVLLLQDPTTVSNLSNEQIAWMRSKGFKLLRQPRITELGENFGALREIKLEELLQRTPINLDPSLVAAHVEGRRVLVTGAGGSIGSEIARQLISLSCSHITLIDHSEFLLFEIDRELSETGPTELSRSAILCNVRDKARLAQIFESERPDLVFHAAALKHVTMVENNPAEGILTNIIGTWNVAQAANAWGATQTVLISTDKAVRPTNVMGATKRIAEAALASMAGGAMQCSAVRFGNVLGSAGSVVPILRDQIARGGPVTVTHPDVERYFMTIPEAVQLVLHAASLSLEGSSREMRKFVLEMGEPVKIIDLAKQMISLSGRTCGVDIAIDIIGLRPGEKLTEILLDTNEESDRCAPGINEIKSLTEEIPFTEADVIRLRELAEQGSKDVRKTVYSMLRPKFSTGRAAAAAVDGDYA